MFSKEIEYAIRALVFISIHCTTKNYIKINEIVENIESPKTSTAKMMQKLVGAKIVESKSGPNGGFRINPEIQKKTNLYDVVIALDYSHFFDVCVLGVKECGSHKPCPVHNHFTTIKEDIKSVLKNTSIAYLSTNVYEGNSFLKL